MTRRDLEFFRLCEDSEVTFKFEWSVGSTQLNGEGCILPTIKLPGASLQFKLRFDNITDHKSYAIYISIHASCPMYISGTYECIYRRDDFKGRSLNSGENKDICYCKLVSPPHYIPSYNFVFDMKVTRLITEAKCTSSKIVNERGKIDADYCRLHLENDIKKLWETKRLSDVEIKVGDQTILAHKNILSTRSPVFAGMFQNETTEATQNVVNITDIPFDTMNLLIGFLYGQHPDFVGNNNMEEVYELYLACDKYQILYLRDVCGQVLVQRMTPGNAQRLIDLFDRHSDSVLEKQVLDYCCLNFKDIVKTRESISEKARFFSLVLEKMSKSNK